jgi:galactose mutarotase-like enzyme
MIDGNVVKLLDRESLVEVDLVGARVKKLVLDKKIVLSDFSRIDGKLGSTHPCTPNFDKDKRGVGTQLPQHGPARNEAWEKLEERSNKLRLGYKIDGKLYPEFLGLEVEQVFLLENNLFTITTMHVNKGSQAMPVNFGEHFYFKTSKPGWERVMVNGEKIAKKVKITGRVELKNHNLITGLGGGDINMEISGLPMATTWIGRDGERYDQKYVCVEPVEGRRAFGDDPGFFGTKESMLEAGDSRITIIKLSLKS